MTNFIHEPLKWEEISSLKHRAKGYGNYEYVIVFIDGDWSLYLKIDASLIMAEITSGFYGGDIETAKKDAELLHKEMYDGIAFQFKN